MIDESQNQNIRRTESGYRFELSALRSSVADAMIFIGTSKSLDEYNSAINHAIAALDTLEDHLAAYIDNDYRIEKFGKHDKKTKERRGGFDSITFLTVEDFKKRYPNEDPEKLERMADEQRLEILRNKLRLRMQALMKLQDRKNLLLEEEAEDHA